MRTRMESSSSFDRLRRKLGVPCQIYIHLAECIAFVRSGDKCISFLLPNTPLVEIIESNVTDLIAPISTT